MDAGPQHNLGTPAERPALLQGIRIADFSWAIIGSYATMLLGLMGAEVIKIESLKRLDICRNVAHIGKSFRFGEKNVETSPVFHDVAVNKLSVRLDLSQPRAVELAREIVRVSDVVVENFRPGVMSRLGLDYASLKKIRPDIIMLSASNCGQEGPESSYSGYAAIFGALAGLSNLTGYADLAPSEIRGGADKRGALWVAFALLAALNYRQNTGRGQFIDYSVQEGIAALVGDSLIDYTMNNRVQSRRGNQDDIMAPHNCYPCRGEDEWVSLAVSTDEEWERLCQAMGKPELTQDERFSEAVARWGNREELDKLIGEWTSLYSKHEVTVILQKAGVAAFPCMNSKDIWQDPHLRARGLMDKVQHPVMGDVSLLTAPWKFSITQPRVSRPAPLIGQHNEYVFKGLLGLSLEEIQKLEEEKVIY